MVPLSLSAVVALSCARYSKPGILTWCIFSLAKPVTLIRMAHSMPLPLAQSRGDVIWSKVIACLSLTDKTVPCYILKCSDCFGPHWLGQRPVLARGCTVLGLMVVAFVMKQSAGWGRLFPLTPPSLSPPKFVCATTTLSMQLGSLLAHSCSNTLFVNQNETKPAENLMVKSDLHELPGFSRRWLSEGCNCSAL